MSGNLSETVDDQSNQKKAAASLLSMSQGASPFLKPQSHATPKGLQLHRSRVTPTLMPVVKPGQLYNPPLASPHHFPTPSRPGLQKNAASATGNLQQRDAQPSAQEPVRVGKETVFSIHQSPGSASNPRASRSLKFPSYSQHSKGGIAGSISLTASRSSFASLSSSPSSYLATPSKPSSSLVASTPPFSAASVPVYASASSSASPSSLINSTPQPMLAPRALFRTPLRNVDIPRSVHSLRSSSSSSTPSSAARSSAFVPISPAPVSSARHSTSVSPAPLPSSPSPPPRRTRSLSAPLLPGQAVIYGCRQEIGYGRGLEFSFCSVSPSSSSSFSPSPIPSPTPTPIRKSSRDLSGMFTESSNSYPSTPLSVTPIPSPISTPTPSTPQSLATPSTPTAFASPMSVERTDTLPPSAPVSSLMALLTPLIKPNLASSPRTPQTPAYLAPNFSLSAVSPYNPYLSPMSIVSSGSSVSDEGLDWQAHTSPYVNHTTHFSADAGDEADEQDEEVQRHVEAYQARMNLGLGAKTPNSSGHSSYPNTPSPSLSPSSASQTPPSPLTHTPNGRSSNGRFTCKECSKTLSTTSALRLHLRLHTGEKPFTCPWEGCEKSFRQKTHLEGHYRLHTGEKPFSCSTCGKKFKDRSGLRVHEKKSCHVNEAARGNSSNNGKRARGTTEPVPEGQSQTKRSRARKRVDSDDEAYEDDDEDAYEPPSKSKSKQQAGQKPKRSARVYESSRGLKMLASATADS